MILKSVGIFVLGMAVHHVTFYQLKKRQWEVVEKKILSSFDQSSDCDFYFHPRYKVEVFKK